MQKSLPETMKAALCSAPGAALEIQEIPVPQPGKGQVLVRLETCGICHSDLHLRDGDENLPIDLYPLVVGHEGIGRIAAWGPGSQASLPTGTRVGLPWLYETCQYCPPCMSGHENFCQEQSARGVQHRGAFAEYALASAEFIIPVPEKLDPLKTAPLLCAGLTAWTALRRASPASGSTVLIIGSGGLGQYAILLAKSLGTKVIVMDQNSSKLQTARTLGADTVVAAGPDAGAAIRKAGGADVVLNFAPAREVWPVIEEAVNPMSTIVAVALIGQPVDLSMMWLIDGGHKVMGSSVGTREDLREFLAFAAETPLEVDVAPVALQDVNAALNRLSDGDVKGRLCVDFSL